MTPTARGRRDQWTRAALFATLLALGLGAMTALGAVMPEIGSARSQPSGEVCFDLPPGLVDWSALAGTTLGAHLVSSPGPALLRENLEPLGGASAIRYPAPVSPMVSGVSWLVLHEAGVLALQPSVLRGRVVYFLDRGSLRIRGGPEFLGEACARPQAADIRAAFVLSHERAESWSSEIAPSAKAGDHETVLIGGTPYRLEKPRYVFTDVKTAVVFRGGGTSLLLVVWEPDDSTCEHQYYLYEVDSDGTLRLTAENSYKCDI